ncbi:MAG: response regulator [Desulfosarcinaceae bacterium]|nr:response regulator [Desulfosarcinaceae bacterium]
MENDVRKDEVQILIVDDDDAIRDVLLHGIRHIGIDCYAAESGLAALEILQRHEIDIVVSDINMPGMNGLELTQQIKAQYDCDVMIMTGFVGTFTYEEIIGRGASDFIQKPIRIPEFIARIKRIIAERDTRDERNQALTEIQRNLGKFKRAMDGIVQAMSLTVEFRDPYTAGHQERVAQLACAIAAHMGLPQDRINGLRMAAIIHDLGKITIPAEILCKPGKLLPLEYELIKNHVQAGYDILKKIEFPWPLADIIYQHHERLDGSGYPNGVEGEQIHLEARIIAVSDVFETIASHRPYRPSLGINSAVEEIRANMGRLYDPVVAEACLHVVEEEGFSFGKRKSPAKPPTHSVKAL